MMSRTTIMYSQDVSLDFVVVQEVVDDLFQSLQVQSKKTPWTDRSQNVVQLVWWSLPC